MMCRVLRAVSAAGLAAGLAVGAGCGGPTMLVGEVEGTVTVDGKPLAQIGVGFIPDAGRDNIGPSSNGRTDDAGRYKLQYVITTRSNLTPDPADGAKVGWHKVVVYDHKMKAERLPPPGRVADGYALVETTPLEFEVKPGKQTFDIAAKSK